eukprot:TRINITY_DN3958_c0_g1_i5.p1 TRINITY_DN3958_c0_g1~~TRINITY_DN3958_c0_g1_i5.p1  ORF type:complete len:490 (+),score=183.13 TRINITY_DN3958_c0_g1_i5:155-1624(+)
MQKKTKKTRVSEPGHYDVAFPTYEKIAVPEELKKELEKKFGDRYMNDEASVEMYGKDQSFNRAIPPDVVVFPESTEEVSEIVKLCSQYKVPIVPFGSGTSLEGHITAIRGGVSISFQRMNSVIEVHKEDLDCVVQPGITYDELNMALDEFGFFFPMDPGPGASIGGMVGTSCSGTNAVRYGTMKNNVVNLTVVLPNGNIVKTAQRARKSSAGYDLTHLFIGAEGTLGVVTEITVKITRKPEVRAIAVSEFQSVHDAAEVAITAIQKGIGIGKMELLDEVMLHAVNLNSGRNYAETPTLFFEFSGTASQVEDQKRQIAEISRKNGGTDLKFAVDPAERDELWMARKTALWAAPILVPGTEVKITDVCVPISRLADCIQETKEDISTSFLKAPIVGHVGDGNFHCFILLDPSSQKDLEEAARLDHRMVERAIKMGGTCTGEHGIGLGKRKYLVKELGAEAVDLMRVIKAAIDPDNIMNPGKVIPDDNRTDG